MVRTDQEKQAMQQDITEDHLYASIRELSDLIRNGKISCEALTEAYLDRLDKHGRKLGAVVTITRDLALKEAQAADKEIKSGHLRGPLHGIPYGVKDLAATKGIPTTWGAEPFKNQVFDYDATIVKKLREAGAVLLAKLSMVELAGGFGYNNADASFTGPGRTPWNTNYWSGGSSSGPGAATAAGLVAFSIGSETSGSIICPSAFCGLSGLRPTYGRVSRHGAMALSWTLDKLGPMCRSADDCGLVLAAIAGKDPGDPTTIAKPFSYSLSEAKAPEQESGKSERRKFKLGVIKGSTNRLQEGVKKNFEESLRILRPFCEIAEDVPLPDLPFDPVVETIVDAEGASAFRDLVDSGRSKELRAANDRWGGYSGSMILAVDYLQAMRLREPMKRAMDHLYAQYDALIAPAWSTVAFPIGKDFDKAYPEFSGGPPIIEAGNAVGQPAISLPNGFGQDNLPTGIQFTGRVWSEGRLLAIANAYQRETDWHKKRPPLGES
jgi:aspartyl-tRNA(Asn)/glutamyl-tRNA(Gln) amidotransferase subunit A